MTNPIDNVLTTMSGSYLNRWKLTPEEENAWRDGLRGFTAEILRKATIDARVDFPEWPPTLMEFRRYCVKEKRRGDTDTETDVIEKYNKWAKNHGFAQCLPKESADQFARRLVWQFERRRMGYTDAELSAFVESNRKANRALRWQP